MGVIQTIDMRKTTMNLSELVSQMTPGSEIIIADGDEPLARVVPIVPIVKKARVLGLHPGAMEPTADFDSPLPDEFWLGSNEPAC